MKKSGPTGPLFFTEDAAAMAERKNKVRAVAAKFTERQGQYLAYIHTYTKLHRQPPAEADMQFYFRVTPPTAHQMILRLDERGLINRTPGQARSIEVLVPHDELPPFDMNILCSG